MKRLSVHEHPTPDSTEIIASFELENGQPQNVTVRSPELARGIAKLEAARDAALEQITAERAALDAREAVARETFATQRETWTESVFAVAEAQYQSAIDQAAAAAAAEPAAS